MRVAGFFKVRDGILRDNELPLVVSQLDQLCTEIFAYDDGSLDGTTEWLLERLGPDNVIRGGRAAGGHQRELRCKQRLLGLVHDHGPWDFVLWLDSDELLPPAALEGWDAFLLRAREVGLRSFRPKRYVQLWGTAVVEDVGEALHVESYDLQPRLWRWSLDLSFVFRDGVGHLREQIPEQLHDEEIGVMPWPLLHCGYTGQRRRLRLLEADGLGFVEGLVRQGGRSLAEVPTDLLPEELLHGFLGQQCDQEGPWSVSAAVEVDDLSIARHGTPMNGAGFVIPANSGDQVVRARAEIVEIDRREALLAGRRTMLVIVACGPIAGAGAVEATREWQAEDGRVLLLQGEEATTRAKRLAGWYCSDAAVLDLEVTIRGVEASSDRGVQNGVPSVALGPMVAFGPEDELDGEIYIPAPRALPAWWASLTPRELDELSVRLGIRSGRGAVRHRVFAAGDLPPQVLTNLLRVSTGVTRPGDHPDPLVEYVVGLVAPRLVAENILWLADQIAGAMRLGAQTKADNPQEPLAETGGRIAVPPELAGAVCAALKGLGVGVRHERGTLCGLQIYLLKCSVAPGEAGLAAVEGIGAQPATPSLDPTADSGSVLPSQGRPRICIMADVPNWAWGRKARALRGALSDSFEIAIWYTSKEGQPPGDFDLFHTFDFPQVQRVPEGAPCVTGVTAHVWKTWGEERVRAWAKKAVALHANSRLLEAELEQFANQTVLGLVVYTPNGVDAEFFHRTRPRRVDDHLVVGWVGKPNPRKGRAIVEDACAHAGVELRVIERKSGDALSAEEMREFYQDLHVLAVASDMDGTPNPALEAAACGVCVVSNRIGNMPEFIVDRWNGRLVADRDSRVYVNPLFMDPEIAVEMGVQARQTVLDAWTWTHQAEHYAELWGAALAQELPA